MRRIGARLFNRRYALHIYITQHLSNLFSRRSFVDLHPLPAALVEHNIIETNLANEDVWLHYDTTIALYAINLRSMYHPTISEVILLCYLLILIDGYVYVGCRWRVGTAVMSCLCVVIFYPSSSNFFFMPNGARRFASTY